MAALTTPKKDPAATSEMKKEMKAEAKPAPTSKAAMTAREAQVSSVFDSCIPGGMLSHPVMHPPSSQH